jgi:opacity protein-like surface antigen
VRRAAFRPPRSGAFSIQFSNSWFRTRDPGLQTRNGIQPAAEAAIDMITMRAKAHALAAVLSATVALTSSAFAGGLNDEPAPAPKTYPAVPVPAPVPIPDTFEWYVRGDIGVNMSSTGDVNVIGAPITVRQLEDLNGSTFSAGFGWGRYLSRNWRSDVTFDFRSENKLSVPNSGYQTTVTVTPGQLGAGTTDTHTYTVNRAEVSRIANHTGLLNAYYDFKNGSAFTPYVGAGAGLAMQVFSRQASESVACSSSVVNGVAQVDGLGNPTCVGAPAATPRSGSKTETSYSPTVALMAGLSYEIRDGIILDAGYRFLWTGGTASLGLPAFNFASSKIEIDDRIDHEIRMGVRWNLY